MIKIDMEMPNCCMKCPFYSGYHDGQCLAQEYGDLYFNGDDAFIDRHPRCLLQEVEDNV